MKYNKATGLHLFLFSFIVYCSFFCKAKTDPQAYQQQLHTELAVIDSLLRDETFALTISSALDSSYYAALKQTPPPFLTPQEKASVIIKPLKNEKVATSLAGFYALECGVGLLGVQTNETPVAWLQKISTGTAGSNAVLVLNRFANATWKAGQPFRGLNRIKRYNFTTANTLSIDEVKKDSIQIKNAASKLLPAMTAAGNGSSAEQMQTLRRLLQDTVYAVEMASYLDSMYAISQHQQPAPFLTHADDTATISKSAKEMKMATSIAGFYALECGLNYLVTTKHQLPSAILTSLINGSLGREDKLIFARFANATWKAGQPFRELNRITRSTFTPFYFLNDADIEKDMVQVKAAAQIVLPLLKA